MTDSVQNDEQEMPETEVAAVGARISISASDDSVRSADEVERITQDLISALKTVYDPEIPVDIYELGLIYKVEIDDDRNVDVLMTLTAASPNNAA